MRNKLGRLEMSILERLIEHGYEAMVVGGAVRDYLLDKEFNDIDIATNAPYDKLVEIMDGLGQLKFAGSLFGVLLVGGVEVATYRSEISKENIVLELDTASNAYQDSLRRDFTVNALYYDYEIDKIWDFHNSSLDIRNKVIKTVGSPYERFNEDYSRILRAIQLSANTGFSIDFLTGKAIGEMNYCIGKIPHALQGKIIRKAIATGTFHKFLKLLEEFDLLDYAFPEISHTVELKQNPKYHNLDVWEHTLKVVEKAEKTHKGDIAFVMGAFLHDIAKGIDGVRVVNKDGQPSDLGHEKAGIPIARKICKRLELGKKVVDEVEMYVKWHGERMNNTIKSVKHFLFKFKNEFRNIDELKDGFNKLVDFMYCDADGFEPSFRASIIFNLYDVRGLGNTLFENHIFYSNQFKFNTRVIAQHHNVKTSEIRERIEFFIRQNIVEEEAMLKILNKDLVRGFD